MKKLIEGDYMDAQVTQWIKQFQQDKDTDALLHLKEHCAVMIEPLIEELDRKSVV